MSDEDFPAAHSMDTEWYAVDSEGNIGIFITGEAGAVPRSSVGYEDGAPTVADLLRSLPPDIGLEYDVDDLVAMQGGPVLEFRWPSHMRGSSVSFSDITSCYSVLMLLTDERLLGPQQVSAKPVQRGLWQSFFSRSSQASSSSSAGSVTVERIPNSKHVLGYIDGPVLVSKLQKWIQDGFVQKAWVNHSLAHTRIGIFHYEHGDAFENWIAGPYLRDSVPRRPLKVEQLPEQIRAIFEAIRFEQRSYARDAAIDPREAGECSSWNSAWLGLDGVVHRDDEDGHGVVT